MSETQTREMVKLNRDTPALLVPSGDPVTLKSGQEVVITQELGGNYTVIVLGNMALIDGRHADALAAQRWQGHVTLCVAVNTDGRAAHEHFGFVGRGFDERAADRNVLGKALALGTRLRAVHTVDLHR